MAPPSSFDSAPAIAGRQALRAEARRRRRAIPAAERDRLARAVARRAISEFPLPRGARVALYLTVGSELPTAPLIALARRRGWRIHVPVLQPGRTPALWFVPLVEPLRTNRYGIPEPVAALRRRVPPRWLDLVFVPLLAFAPDGQRLGSGAGFYDRSFAFRRCRGGWRKPPLVGLAFECQRVDHLAAQPWDVPLDAVVTERALHRSAP